MDKFFVQSGRRRAPESVTCRFGFSPTIPAQQEIPTHSRCQLNHHLCRAVFAFVLLGSDHGLSWRSGDSHQSRFVPPFNKDGSNHHSNPARLPTLNALMPMNFAEEITRVLIPPLQKFQSSTILKLIFGFFWCLLHLLVSLVHLMSSLNQLLVSSIISTGLLSKYQNLRMENLKCLAIVVDSEETRDTTKITQLLSWLSSIGVKYVSLYDMQGVLKKTLGNHLKSLINTSTIPCLEEDTGNIGSRFQINKMTIEILSFSDGKEGIAKAASLLCSKYVKDEHESNNRAEPTITESEVTNALKAIGYEGPEPELLLVYGAVRCLLGFPAWRLRYTEIVHMGSLRSMNYGGVLKAMYDFSKKHQNYGK